ncbi:hypothetical protein EJ08DRAFT_88400 [Tothia fuscella]|uniref:Uncharacterized protein n=1 Tax=Tothia fuscella TaxID=1048955 RepID=A0A9P4U1K7_9PEZI|nr:hypothetical protein EJ08DRAFT_88400 [Tothia fuscella]
MHMHFVLGVHTIHTTSKAEHLVFFFQNPSHSPLSFSFKFCAVTTMSYLSNLSPSQQRNSPSPSTLHKYPSPNWDAYVPPRLRHPNDNSHQSSASTSSGNSDHEKRYLPLNPEFDAAIAAHLDLKLDQLGKQPLTWRDKAISAHTSLSCLLLMCLSLGTRKLGHFYQQLSY